MRWRSPAAPITRHEVVMAAWKVLLIGGARLRLPGAGAGHRRRPDRPGRRPEVGLAGRPAGGHRLRGHAAHAVHAARERLPRREARRLAALTGPRGPRPSPRE